MLPEKQSKKFHIALTGNVGTGKSTLAKLIQQQTGCKIYLEEPEDHLFLQLFFAAPYEWAFLNQLHFILNKFAQQAYIHDQNQIAVQENDARTVYSIWIPAQHEIGYISQAGVAAIERVFDLGIAAPISTPDLVIVLCAAVETICGRIQQRGRDYECLDPKFVQLLTSLDKHITRYSQEIASNNVMMVDTEAVNLTQPSPVRDALLNDIARQIHGG